MPVALPTDVTAYLDASGVKYSVAVEANMACVVLHQFRLPAGYDRAEVDLLLRLSPGFPDVQPDMWWFDPHVHLADGRVIKATQVVENHVGRRWQRWSRHLPAGQWQQGTDSLETFLAMIRAELVRCAQ